MGAAMASGGFFLEEAWRSPFFSLAVKQYSSPPASHATALLAAFILARSATFAPVTDTLYVGRAWLTCLATAIPYVAFLGLVGAVVGKSRRVLSVAVFFWIGLGIVGGAITHWQPALDITPYLFPSVARFHLLTDSFSMALPTLAHLVLFSVACVGLGLWRFRRRDL